MLHLTDLLNVLKLIADSFGSGFAFDHVHHELVWGKDNSLIFAEDVMWLFISVSVERESRDKIAPKNARSSQLELWEKLHWHLLRACNCFGWLSMDEIEHYVGCFFLWDLYHDKIFLLAPSTALYLLLNDRALDSIPARLVPEDLRAWQFMHAAFVKSGLAKKSHVTMAC